MSHQILITGGSGYLGGTLLAHLKSALLPSYKKLFALVRTTEQANAVKKYGATPLTIDTSEPTSLKTVIIEERITIVFHLHDATDTTSTAHSIAGLGEVKKVTGLQTHFLFTTGAKAFSEFVGLPTERPLYDTDPDLYALQKRATEHNTPFDSFRLATKANCAVIDAAEVQGVHSYIFIPCIVYGEGQGFGNKISIQTVAIIKAAKALRQVYRVQKDRPSWPVCHVSDNADLYIELLRSMLEGRTIGHGKSGYYLASSGKVIWDDIYDACSASLKTQGVVDEQVVRDADDDTLNKMAEVLGAPAQIQLAGLCSLTAENGSKIGWVPRYKASHILEAADDEVSLVLQHLKE